MSRIKLWAGLVVLFGSGVLTGVVGTHLVHGLDRGYRGERGPAAQHERMMKRLTAHLSLSDAQQAVVEPIVARAHRDMLELRVAHQHEIDQIMTRSMADLKETLSAEQQAKLDQMYVRLQGRWQSSREHLEVMKKRIDGPR